MDQQREIFIYKLIGTFSFSSGIQTTSKRNKFSHGSMNHGELYSKICIERLEKNKAGIFTEVKIHVIIKFKQTIRRKPL
jgi:hypothetical protein